MDKHSTRSQGRSRRDFLKTSALALAGGSALAAAGRPFPAHAAGSDVLRLGLVGCGARGTGAAVNALCADKNTKLVAMADLFEDRLATSLATLQKSDELAAEDIVGHVDVPPERRFVGFDAYQKLIASKVDVVLLATPPHFRPVQFKAAVDAGLHVFAEKPVAVDGPGVRSVLATCKEAAKKNLSVVSGLCLRYYTPYQELVKRIHDGELGEVRVVQANDYRGPIWVRPRLPGEDDMHWETRNWYYFTWLSGDFNVEQHVHCLDVGAWILKGQYPVSAIGMGGRQVRTGPEYGNIFDHHSVVYDYADGAKLFSNTRQMRGCASDNSAWAAGSKGLAHFSERRNGVYMNAGDQHWRYKGKENNLYQAEHEALFEAIRSGKPINNGEYMCKSTLMAILGRMATYTGQVVTWQQAIESQEDLTPPGGYKWGPLPPVSIAVPGVTQVM